MRQQPISPLVLMQRQAGLYPGGLHPAMLRRTQMQIRAPRSLSLRGFGATSTLQQGITGVKAGATAASVSTAVGAGVASAIGAGAAAGSVVPIIGTAIGAIVGLFASGVLNHKADPEVANFNQAVSLYNTNPQNALNIANKYLVLAGLFDLQPSQIKGNIPIYKKYGRMGEEHFVRDLAATIQTAANTGRITANDTPMSVYQNVVQPWISSFGYGPMQDTNGDMINTMILGMTAEYLANQQNRWFAVGGDYPFGNLPAFHLPVATTAAAPPAPVYTPAQTPTPQMPTPQIVMSPANTSLLPSDLGKTLNTPAGYFQFSGLKGPNNTFAVLRNGASAGYGIALLWDGSQVYLKQPSGEIDVWGGVSWLPYQNAPPLSSGGTSAPPAGVQVPPGYTPISASLATSGGLPVYVDAQGTYWQLSGTTLSPYNGTISYNGQLVPIQNGLVTQSAIAQLPQSPASFQTGVSTPAFSAPAPTPIVINSPAAAAPVPVTSGLSGNTPLWIAGGLAVLAVVFATARPMSMTLPTRRRA